MLPIFTPIKEIVLLEVKRCFHLEQIPGKEKEDQTHKQKTSEYGDKLFVHGLLHTPPWF
jgi:hypothetical protein